MGSFNRKYFAWSERKNCYGAIVLVDFYSCWCISGTLRISLDSMVPSQLVVGMNSRISLGIHVLFASSPQWIPKPVIESLPAQRVCNRLLLEFVYRNSIILPFILVVVVSTHLRYVDNPIEFWMNYHMPNWGTPFHRTLIVCMWWMCTLVLKSTAAAWEGSNIDASTDPFFCSS